MSEPMQNASASAPVSLPLPTSGLAVGSLVAAILGWVLLPVLGAGLGLVLGYMARKETRGPSPTASGDGIATAGIVISWINIGLLGCGCAIILILMLLGPAIGNTFSTINSSQY